MTGKSHNHWQAKRGQRVVLSACPRCLFTSGEACEFDTERHPGQGGPPV